MPWIAVSVGEGATLDWLPQETIVFEGARLKARAPWPDVAPERAPLACGWWCWAAASGERFTGGLLLDSWSVRRAGKLAWTDTLRVEGETPSAVVRCGQRARHDDRRLGRARRARFERARALEERGKVRAGVTLVNGVMVARLLGEGDRGA